jgi:hypothetical protein
MIQEPQLEDRLRAALRRPEGSPWPEEHGAFDQFLHRRARRGRTLVARDALAVVVAVALVVGIPRLLPSRPVVPATPPLTGLLLQMPAGGFEVTVPAGWTDLSRSRRNVTPATSSARGSGCGRCGGPPTPW